MKLTAKQIAELTDGNLVGDSNPIITGAAGLEDAGENDISFVSNPKYIKQVAVTKAGLLLLPEKFDDVKRPVIKVKNPQLAFAKILHIIAKERQISLIPGVHPTAVIAPNAKLGAGVFIGPFVVIEDDVLIGDRTKILAQTYIGKASNIGTDCLLYPNTTIRENTKIGNNVIIHSGTTIGADGFGFVSTQTGHFKIPQIGMVEIGDDVEIGANVTIDRATIGKTKIGKGTKIDNLVMIAHNVQIGENCIIVAQAGIAGSTKIGKNVTIAAQSGIIGHAVIGDGAIVAARAGVIGDIGKGEIVSGYPARNHKEAMKIYALTNKLPLIYEEIKHLWKNKKQ